MTRLCDPNTFFLHWILCDKRIIRLANDIEISHSEIIIIKKNPTLNTCSVEIKIKFARNYWPKNRHTFWDHAMVMHIFFSLFFGIITMIWRKSANERAKSQNKIHAINVVKTNCMVFYACAVACLCAVLFFYHSRWDKTMA